MIPPIRSCAGPLALSLIAFLLPTLCAGPVEVEPEQMRPGLIAEYSSRSDPTARIARIDAKPAFYLGHSSPHPRLPAGPLEVVWKGLLELKDPGPLTFDAWVGGELAVEIDGVNVLQGKGESDTHQLLSREKFDRPRGYYPITIRYRSLAQVPARLQIGWEGPTFAREPLPAWQLKHALVEEAVVRPEELASRGRELAGRLGCARCHSSAFPGVSDPPPGPALGELGSRVQRDWLLRWLENPAAVHSDTRMPALFSSDRPGFVERWLIADTLLGPETKRSAPEPGTEGNHRTGRLAFIHLGCAACHPLPDLRREEQLDLGRTALRGLGDRLPAETLAAFLTNPHARYPDGRMPRVPMTPETARHIAAYLLFWSGPSKDLPVAAPPTREELDALSRRLKVRNRQAAGATLIREKGCAVCHPGLDASRPLDIPLPREGARPGCPTGQGWPRFVLDAETVRALEAYRQVAARETDPAPFAARQRLLQQSGCLRCHQRDSDRPPLIEEAGSTLGGSNLQLLPFQRTPRLNDPLQKYTRSYLSRAIREGVSGLRAESYSYRMPAFGASETLVQALAEGDGELPAGGDLPSQPANDPTLGPLTGSQLAGFQGYSCFSCHIWQGKQLSQPDPGALGPDLTRLTGRIRRDWFDRFLDNPTRSHPGTPMPSVFFRGKPALLSTVLEGDPARQKEALWSYFALGIRAPSPRPPPPLTVTPPSADGPPLVAQIPIRLPEGNLLESIALLSGENDLLLYDVGTGTLHSLYIGARLQREVQGRLRRFLVEGELLASGFAESPPLRLLGRDKTEPVQSIALQGYDLLPEGVRIRSQAHFPSVTVEQAEDLRFGRQNGKRSLVREIRITGIPQDRKIELLGRIPDNLPVEVAGQAATKRMQTILAPGPEGSAEVVVRYELPPPRAVPPVERAAWIDPAPVEGSLSRPGYRALAYPRPRAASGEDLLMPSAVAAHPRDGRVFVASMKMGEIFVLRDPTGDGKSARFENYARGLFQEAYSLLAEEEGLYVLHRRNLTRLRDSGRDTLAQRVDRIAALPHGVAETYDYGYGLVRDRTGAFVFSFAPYANTSLPGSGGALRLVPGQPPKEFAFGMRNPLGWCSGPEGEIFFTDNQGEWVASNKLCHLEEGRFYGFPNPAQRQHASRPAGQSAVWVPYDWARSINGVSYDRTGGKFGPFAGQFFLAELMFGGAIIRAQLEKVNGVYQGACFPFWGKGLLGPLCLTFDPGGRLWVGSITEPGWMAQPDRGALYRIDCTGEPFFEIQSIHVRPRGFRVVFTAPVAEQARNPASYQIEHFRYEYTGAYGSPELDRTRLSIDRIVVAPDGRSVDVTTGPLVKDRVYLITARGVRSTRGEMLVHPTGAYTLHEVPVDAPP